MNRSFKGDASSLVLRLLLGVSSVLMISACQSQPKMLGAPVTGYNHTSAAINRFTVNGAGGPNIGPHQGGGSEVCCGLVPREWVPGLKAIVEWEKDPDPYAYAKWPERPYSDAWNKRMEKAKQEFSHHKVAVDIPRYEIAGSLKVHFLPCDQVRVSADNIKRGDPRYPYNYPMNMEGAKVCSD
ncbi:DUF3304 domain-containing protein [Pseudomonas chlororaphis]|jgi:hypothetical protein|uniref:DUF3304 domain-containing protein n=1 Tax=Pseudomonas chlororaphis TaxID=587753 RepID=UPI0024084047|nr:DUF3304 domain-containing protein [Pseudomonas chlororaphis]